MKYNRYIFLTVYFRFKSAKDKYRKDIRLFFYKVYMYVPLYTAYTHRELKQKCATINCCVYVKAHVTEIKY